MFARPRLSNQVGTSTGRVITRAWITWGVVTLTGFGVIEGYALSGRAPEGATLSAHLRRALGIHPRKPWHNASRIVLISALSALATHLIIVEVEEHERSTQDLLSRSSMVERTA